MDEQEGRSVEELVGEAYRRYRECEQLPDNEETRRKFLEYVQEIFER